MHRIEQGRLDSLPGTKGVYSSWQELATGLEAMLGGARRIAMQYSPNNAIMYVSMVDAGTVEFLRSMGKQIVSSADMVSQFEAVLRKNRLPATPWRRKPLTKFSPKAGKRWAAGCAPQTASGQGHRV